jgi:hypothetical protein
MSSAAAASARAFGIDRGLPFPLPDLARADVILLAGTIVSRHQPGEPCAASGIASPPCQLSAGELTAPVLRPVH